MKKADSTEFVKVTLSPRLGRIVGAYALLAMHGWFFAKLGLLSETGGVEVLVGLAALTGMVASIVFFVSSYGVLANAPDAMLDERELIERNRAYFTAFKYLVVMTIAGGMIPEFLSKVFRFELSVGVMKNFMLLMFTTALVLPGAVLAWADRGNDD